MERTVATVTTPNRQRGVWVCVVQLSCVTDVGLVCVVERYDLTELKEYYYYYYYYYGAVSCEEVDVVSVYVTLDDVRREIGSFCGSKRPPPLMSPDSRMELEFISRTLPDTKDYRGFNVSFNFLKGRCAFPVIPAQACPLQIVRFLGRIAHIAQAVRLNILCCQKIQDGAGPEPPVYYYSAYYYKSRSVVVLFVRPLICPLVTSVRVL